jgi:N-acetylglucosaminyl-diphospho-decaprenol L-rhamnosyltransferase
MERARMTSNAGDATYSVVIVTHNSERHLHKNIEALDRQSQRPQRIVIADSGSDNRSYLQPYRARPDIVVVTDKKDIGFCRGNNLGMRHVASNSSYILFLNPDAFLTSTFCEDALQIMEDPDNTHVGALSGSLIGYDISQDTATGRFDSTGIFRTWYGHWYDRHQGKPVNTVSLSGEEAVPALCGALMFCRRSALDEVLLRGDEVWDSTFYMYKDDIDLSLRLRRKGWQLLFVPRLIAYHCRGWQVNRRKMPREFRLLSAKNEIRVNARAGLFGIPYSLAKYCAVKALDW